MSTLTLRPNGDNSVQLTRSTGSYNYACVDEVSADDADFVQIVYGTSAQLKDIYSFPDHTTESGTINSVTLYARCRYQQAGQSSSSHLHLCPNSTTEGTQQQLTTSYALYSQAWTTNPATGNAWTWAEIDALLAGPALAPVRSDAKDYTWPDCSHFYVKVVDYTPPVAPTVTTQAASSVEVTTATGNGNITATGGATISAWGICWCLASHSETPDTGDNVVAGSGSGGTGAFTAAITGLSGGTAYHFRAYATNSAGTSYGSTVDVLTKPAAPTNVAASDGTYTDKVRITWTKSTGASDYHVWRDASDLGAAGDVDTFDDTGATAPVITPGTASASDGTSPDYVTLGVAGESAANGTTHTYKVVASNATGNSADSSTNTGYRGTTTLTYLWYRSSGDADSSFSSIGGTTDPYNDTGAPADGSGRYYYCAVAMTGATTQNTTHDRGYRTSGWAHISQVNGVAAAAISQMNGVAVASISQINGIAV